MVVLENQVAPKFGPKPVCNLPVVKDAPEYVHAPKSKPPFVIFEAPPNFEYVDPFWEAIQRQEEAFKQVREVARQVEN